MECMPPGTSSLAAGQSCYELKCQLHLDDNELSTRLQINIVQGKGGLCHQSCLRSEVLHQSHFPNWLHKLPTTGPAPEISLFGFLSPSLANFTAKQMPGSSVGASATLYHSTGSARCCSLCPTHFHHGPWYYVVRAAGFASAPSSVHRKRNNPSAFL